MDYGLIMGAFIEWVILSQASLGFLGNRVIAHHQPHPIRGQHYQGRNHGRSGKQGYCQGLGRGEVFIVS